MAALSYTRPSCTEPTKSSDQEEIGGMQVEQLLSKNDATQELLPGSSCLGLQTGHPLEVLLLGALSFQQVDTKTFFHSGCA